MLDRKNPSFAIALWFEGDHLRVSFENSHEISIPIEHCGIVRNNSGTALPNQRGWDFLLNLLMERYHQSSRQTIAQKGAPIQYMVEQFLKAKSIKKDKRKLTLEDLGL